MSIPSQAWKRIGLAPTNDIRAIRRAYSQRLKSIDVEADPAAFIALREAYEFALNLAQRGSSQPPAPAASQPPEPPLETASVEVATAPATAVLTRSPSSEFDDADLNHLIELLDGGQEYRDRDTELLQVLERLLEAVPGVLIERASRFEWWLAETIARTAPRSDVLLDPAIAAFNWGQRSSEWRMHPAVRAVVQRRLDLELKQQLLGGRHRWAAAFRELTRPVPTGFKWVGPSMRADMRRLLENMRGDHRSLTLDVDPKALDWWTRRVFRRSAAGQAWSRVAKVLPGGAAVWDRPRPAKPKLRASKAIARYISLVWIVLIVVGGLARCASYLSPGADAPAEPASACGSPSKAPVSGGEDPPCLDGSAESQPVSSASGPAGAGGNGGLAAMDARGRFFAAGPPGSRNPSKAAFWFRQAANGGYAPSMTHLGMLNAAKGGITGNGANEAEAVRWYRQAADRNDPEGLYELARAYESGEALPKDDAAAFGLYKRAAGLGLAPATARLGLMYDRGLGVRRDQATALGLYRQAAAKNDPTGEFLLADRYLSGHGVGRSPAHGRDLLRAAAAGGSLDATAELAELDFDSASSPANRTAAIQGLQAAADKGAARAMYDLGLLAASGRGLPKDDNNAMNWFTKAASAGFTPAIAAQERLIAEMHSQRP